MDEIKVNIRASRLLDPTILKTPFNEWYEQVDPCDRDIIHFHMDIYSIDENGEKLDEIGYMKGEFFDLEYGMSEEPYCFFELCDSVSQDLCNMASAIINKEGIIKEYICGPDEKLLYLDRLYIKPKYRNRGIGSYVINEIKRLLEYFCQLSPDVAVIFPSPQEEVDDLMVTIKDKKEYKTKKKRLVQLYKSCGFQNITDEEFMFKRLNYDRKIIFVDFKGGGKGGVMMQEFLSRNNLGNFTFLMFVVVVTIEFTKRLIVKKLKLIM